MAYPKKRNSSGVITEQGDMPSQVWDHQIEDFTDEKYRKEVKAEPVGHLEAEFIESALGLNPMNVGVDGYIYAAPWQGNVLYRTNDEFATTETGFDFSTAEPTGQIISANNTHGGYVVFIKRDDDTGAIYHSSNFATGFTLVLDAPITFDRMSVHYYNGQLNERIILAGEYSQQVGTPHKLYLSVDGGQTWEMIKETIVNDTNVNAHWHTAIYDPYTGRIYASNGDGSNRALWFSEDLGSTWEELTVPENNLGMNDYLQPTLMIPFNKKITAHPDTSVPSSLFGIYKDESFKQVGEEKLSVKWEHSIWDGVSSGSFFGFAPYAKQKDEAYMFIPCKLDNPNKNAYIVATGDGGNSWHTVKGFRFNKYTNVWFHNGIAGLDQNGNMYAYVELDGVSYIMKANRLDWNYA